MSPLTKHVAVFAANVSLAEVPASVQRLAARSILDGLGLAVAGSRSTVHRIARAHVKDIGSSPQATILGTSDLVAVRHAAFVNGVAIHADDYDDTQLATANDRVYGLLTHPTAPVLPAVLGLVERQGGSGADLLTSYLVGVEVASKVAEAIHPRHYQHGFHSTGTAGSIGAGAGAARAIGLDEDRTAVAISAAASQAAGLRENFGTMMKPFHAGRAAESGVVAADISRRGITGADTILEADRGFFRAAGGGYDDDLIRDRLGDPWVFEHPGISIKPHPSGSLTHPGMWAMLELLTEHDIAASDIERIVVGTNSNMPNALIHHRPADELQAKFSMEFCMAILALERRAGLAEFTDETVARPDVAALIERVEFGTDPEVEKLGYSEMVTDITVTLTDGQVLRTRGVYGKGHPQNPMTDDELTEKFLACLDWAGIPASAGREVAERVLDIGSQLAVRDLVEPLARPSLLGAQG